MNRSFKLPLFLAAIFSVSLAWAQDSPNDPAITDEEPPPASNDPLSTSTTSQERELTPEEAEALLEGCAACGGSMAVMIGVSVAFLVLNIVLLVWVARDAKNRGMDSSVLWMLLVFFLGLIGFLIYIFSRPKGNLVQCAACHNKRMQASVTCPHCGNA